MYMYSIVKYMYMYVYIIIAVLHGHCNYYVGSLCTCIRHSYRALAYNSTMYAICTMYMYFAMLCAGSLAAVCLECFHLPCLALLCLQVHVHAHAHVHISCTVHVIRINYSTVQEFHKELKL